MAEPSVSSAVQHQAAAVATIRARAAISAASVSMEPSGWPLQGRVPAAVHTSVTCMRFWVSVPVLSVQMVVVDPRVSTADSRFTTAPRRARSWTPTAKARVMVGRRPSGTLATIRPMAKLMAAARDSPAAAPRGKKAAAATMATTAISLATCRTCRSRGLLSRPTRSDSAAIRPIWVRIPVAVTTACASPPRQALPLNSNSGACSRSTVGSAASAARVTGCDSPVRVDRSTSTVPVRMRASALIRSPSSMTSTSPGTKVVAATKVRTPLRTTVAWAGR